MSLKMFDKSYSKEMKTWSVWICNTCSKHKQLQKNQNVMMEIMDGVKNE